MIMNRRKGIDVAHHAAAKCVVLRFEADGVPSCTLDVVTSMHAAYDEIAAAKKSGSDVAYLMLSSNMRGIFNMGGDLAAISSMARGGDRAGLEHYGRLTAGLVHRTWSGLGQGIPTFSAVDGDAFGGGCEAALSANFTIASCASRFAFPESRFGLFPGMGATSIVGRRVSPIYATNMISGGWTLTATEAHRVGLIDRVVQGRVEKTLLSTLARIGKNGEIRLGALAGMRARHAAYSADEAMKVVMVWVDAVLAAPEKTLKHMERIVAAQRSRLGREAREAVRTTQPNP